MPGMKSWFDREPRTEPAFEFLKDRLLVAAQPAVAVAGGGDVLSGETTHVTVTFDRFAREFAAELQSRSSLP